MAGILINLFIKIIFYPLLCLIYSGLLGLPSLVFKDLCISFHYFVIPSLRTPPHDVGVGQAESPAMWDQNPGSGILSQKAGLFYQGVVGFLENLCLGSLSRTG